MRSSLCACGILTVLLAPSAAGDLTSDKVEDIKTCESKLAFVFTPKHRVTLPRGGAAWKADCPGGDPLGASASVDVPLGKEWFAAGIGPPDTLTIESATQDVVENSGGPAFSFDFDANAVHGTVTCSNGPFGGGVTGSFRITVVLRELMNSARAAHIGRMCSAWALSPGEPK